MWFALIFSVFPTRDTRFFMCLVCCVAVSGLPKYQKRREQTNGSSTVLAEPDELNKLEN